MFRPGENRIAHRAERRERTARLVESGGGSWRAAGPDAMIGAVTDGVVLRGAVAPGAGRGRR